ncbi:MAG TPA: MFS transporter [Mycobacterium sp.]|jgi:MFS family permease
MPEFGRLIAVRVASQFGDGLFQAGLAGAILFNPNRAATPWAIAASFAVLFLPYSLIGPFAGALLDRWDRRYVLVAANAGRLVLIGAVSALLAIGAGDLPIFAGALIANGFTRFVTSGLSAALPHVVPREQVVTMNSLATAAGAVAAFCGANFMLLPRWLFGADDTGSAAIIFIVLVPVAVALLLSLRFPSQSLGPDDTRRTIRGSAFYAVATGWLWGARTVIGTPSVAATLSALAAHRVTFGINTMLMLVILRHIDTQSVGGLGIAVVFVAVTAAGSFIATLLTPTIVRQIGRFASANMALAAATVLQLVVASLILPVIVVCGFFLGAAGQVVKLCADSAMQIDVDDPRRGHVFAVQDSLFWVAFVGATAAAAAVIPDNGRSPWLGLAGAAVYLAGLALHTILGRSGAPGHRR